MLIEIKKRNNTLIREFWRWTRKCLWFQTVLKNEHSRTTVEQQMNKQMHETSIRLWTRSLISGFVNENEDEHSRTAARIYVFQWVRLREKQSYTYLWRVLWKKKLMAGFQLKFQRSFAAVQRKPEQLRNCEGLFAAVQEKLEQLKHLWRVICCGFAWTATINVFVKRICCGPMLNRCN